jgi:hypothetical protein
MSASRWRSYRLSLPPSRIGTSAGLRRSSATTISACLPDTLMVIDTSALIAILLGETDAPALVDVIAADDTRLIAAPTLVETAAVMLARKGPQA